MVSKATVQLKAKWKWKIFFFFYSYACQQIEGWFQTTRHWFPIPCMTGCFQTRRRCHTEPCCRWICQGFWWRCFPRRSSSVMGHAVTTWCAQAAPWSRQSSWCPVHARLQTNKAEVIGESLRLQRHVFKATKVTRTLLWAGPPAVEECPPPPSLMDFEMKKWFFQYLPRDHLHPYDIPSQPGGQQGGVIKKYTQALMCWHQVCQGCVTSAWNSTTSSALCLQWRPF